MRHAREHRSLCRGEPVEVVCMHPAQPHDMVSLAVLVVSIIRNYFCPEKSQGNQSASRDHWILDVLLCNVPGTWVGMKMCQYLGMTVRPFQSTAKSYYGETGPLLVP